LADNHAAGNGGGIEYFGGTLAVDNCTIADNTASGGGGIAYSFGFGPTIYDSIIARNSGTNPDVQGAFTSQGYNLIGDTTGSIGFGQTGDQTNVSPGLGTLQNNGGPTQTIALLLGSPAIDHGNNAGVAATTDQRGFARIANGTIDIGAVEYQTDLGVTLTPSASPATAGAALSYTVTVTNHGPDIVDGALTPVALTVNYDATDTAFLSWTCPPGWTAALPGAGTVTAVSDAGTLPSGSTATFTLQVSVNDGVADGTILSTATTVANALDANAANNAAVDFTPVGGIPAPILASLGENSISEGSSAFTLTINGSRFVTGAQVLWGSTPLTTATVSTTQLQAAVPAILLTEENSTPCVITVQQDSSASGSLPFTVTDAPLAPLILPFPLYTLEGTPYNGGVAMFADSNPLASTTDFSDYAAMIDWGDGSNPTAGTISYDSYHQGYVVSGSHVYAADNNYTITVTVNDVGTQLSIANGIRVFDVALNSNGNSLAATEGMFNGVVTTFTDTNPLASVTDFSEYSATIDWGDGLTSPGTVGYDTVNHVYTVIGNHTYAEEGSFTTRVTVSDALPVELIGVVPPGNNLNVLFGSPLVVTCPVTVADAPLSASVNVAAIEGIAFSGAVAVFTDADPNGTLADYSATLDWGDGISGTGAIAYNAISQRFEILGNHTYAEEGAYTVGVTIRDNGGSSNSLTGTANVSDALLLGSPSFLNATKGRGLSGAIASFIDTDPNGTATDYTALVDWGDGSSPTVVTGGSGEVTSNGAGFDVNAPHAYSMEGSFNVSVTIQDAGTRTTVHSVVVVSGPVAASVANLPATATTLTITGAGFDAANAANNLVVLSSGAGIVTAATATTLTVTLTTPPTAGILSAAAIIDGVGSGDFTPVATVVPVVTAAAVNVQATAKTLIITGAGFDPIVSHDLVALSSGAGTVTAATPTRLTVTLSSAPRVGSLLAGVFVNSIDSRGLTQVAQVIPGPASAAGSFVLTPASFSAGGAIAVTLRARDALGNNESTGGLKVKFALAAGSSGGTLGAVIDNHNGTYTATFTSPTLGSDTFTATLNSARVASTATTTVIFQSNFAAGSGGNLGAPWLIKAGSFTADSGTATAGASAANLAIYRTALRDVSESVTVSAINLNATAALVGRYGGSGNASMYLAGIQNIAGSIYAVIQKNVAGKVSSLFESSMPLTSTEFPGSGTITFEAVGSSLRLFLNGTLIGAATDTGLTKGSIGIWASP
jgi:hypothetical protein